MVRERQEKGYFRGKEERFSNYRLCEHIRTNIVAEVMAAMRYSYNEGLIYEVITYVANKVMWDLDIRTLGCKHFI